MDERRRYPRRRVDGACTLVPTTLPVRVLDIGEGGVLLHGDQPVAVGTSACLRFMLGRQPFSADLVVQRVTDSSRPTEGYRLAGAFLSLPPEHRRLLERLMNQ